jgi:hypothetical protein
MSLSLILAGALLLGMKPGAAVPASALRAET